MWNWLENRDKDFRPPPPLHRWYSHRQIIKWKWSTDCIVQPSGTCGMRYSNDRNDHWPRIANTIDPYKFKLCYCNAWPFSSAWMAFVHLWKYWWKNVFVSFKWLPNVGRYIMLGACTDVLMLYVCALCGDSVAKSIDPSGVRSFSFNQWNERMQSILYSQT